MVYVYFWFKRLFSLLTRPVSVNKDIARREFILNILLLTAIILTFSLTVVSIIVAINKGNTTISIAQIILLCVLAIFITGYVLSRLGKSRIVALGFLIIYFCSATYTGFQWGIDTPQALLIYALTIVMGGILINARFGFFVTIKVIAAMILFITLEKKGIIKTSSSWRLHKVEVEDIIVFSITFLIMATVSWLFNKEMEKSLQRARESEAALKAERDLLEIKVEERTKELQKAQLEKMTEMYRFAEMGKISSGIFHDLATPLSIVSLTLESLDEQSKSTQKKDLQAIREQLERAMTGTKRLESFVKAARKHVQNQDIKKPFSVIKEIQEAMQMLQYKARRNYVQLQLIGNEKIELYGNPIKFHQFISNLISNAIDAYPGRHDEDEQRIVYTALRSDNKNIYINVKDYGSGIPAKYINSIFEPLFTTKSIDRGTGLGLSITKDIVEKNFKGIISVYSKEGEGTEFTIEIPLQTIHA